jgi:hypothetical protein
MIGIRIPAQLKAYAGGVLLALVVGAVVGAYFYGKHTVQEKWDREIASAKGAAKDIKAGQNSVSTTIKTVYVDRIKVVKEKGDVIYKQVPVLIPADSCPLPGGFRILHDAAATNSIPGTAEGTDAAEVPVRDAASTIVSNYTTCNSAIVNLYSLRDWVRQQRDVYLALCKEKPALCK